MAPDFSGFDLALTPYHLVPTFGVCIQLALAVWIYTLAPRDPRHRAFAVLLVGNGLWDFIELVLEPAATTPQTLLTWVRFKQYVVFVAIGGLAALVSHYPRPIGLARVSWGTKALVATTAAAFIVLMMAPKSHAVFEVTSAPGAPHGIDYELASVGPLRLLNMLWFPLLLVGAARTLTHVRRVKQDGAAFLIGTALLIYPIWSLGISLGNGRDWLRPPTSRLGIEYHWIRFATYDVSVVTALVLGTALVFHAIRFFANRRMPITMVLTLGIAFLAGLLGAWGLARDALYGMSAVAFGSIIAYALASHKLFDIDVKIRWGLSKGTVAAVFIAVFFTASELAQQFFGDRLGGPYVGILAAGGLVFAIAPLSRAADRIALKAVPVSDVPFLAPSPPRDEQGALRDYRAAVRMALRDGQLSRDDEHALLRLAERAGIPASKALSVHHEMELDATGADAPKKSARARKRGR